MPKTELTLKIITGLKAFSCRCPCDPLIDTATLLPITSFPSAAAMAVATVTAIAVTENISNYDLYDVFLDIISSVTARNTSIHADRCTRKLRDNLPKTRILKKI